jgi:hypothetical protein
MTEENKPTAQRNIFAQWCEGVVGHSHFPWPTLRSAVFALASVVAVWGYVVEASIPLTVKCLQFISGGAFTAGKEVVGI